MNNKTSQYVRIVAPKPNDQDPTITALTRLIDGQLMWLATEPSYQMHNNPDHCSVWSLVNEGQMCIIPKSWTRPASPAEIEEAKALEANAFVET